MSPSVVDIDGNGSLEVLTAGGSGCIWGWDNTGQPLAGFPWTTFGGCDSTPRINASLAIGDVDGDNALEIVAGTRGHGNDPGNRGRVFVWNADGSTLPGWPREIDWDWGEGVAEVYSVALADVAGNRNLEVLAGTSNNPDGAPNLYAWYTDGSLLPGYPTSFKSGGIFGLIGAGDLTGDGKAEVIAGRDRLYLHAYGPDGKPLPGWPVQTYVTEHENTWGDDPYIEYTRNAPISGDLDGDGIVETVVAGKVRHPDAGHEVTNGAVVVVRPDGNRRAGWKTAKLSDAPVSDAWRPSQAPALADLDGDGSLEIVVALFDGKIRAYREDGSIMWTHDFAQGRQLFGSEPAIGDVTGDGTPDIIFGAYSPDGSANHAVGIYGLDASGTPLSGFPLALSYDTDDSYQGVRAGPTLTDLDGDGDVEILANSWAGTLYAWDLPAAYDADRMPWPTGRQNNLRSGAYTGNPWERVIDIPGQLELEHYRGGGEGVGYHDTTAGNQGGEYRQDDVDIRQCNTYAGCYSVGWTASSEWLAYDVDVRASSDYTFGLRVASAESGGRIHVELDGKDVTGPIAVPNTGSANTWTYVHAFDIPLSAGEKTLRVVVDTGDVHLDRIYARLPPRQWLPVMNGP